MIHIQIKKLLNKENKDNIICLKKKKNETQEQLHYIDEVRKRIETNEPITEEDITNVTAIFEGKSVSLNSQEQNLNKESFQTHK